jgi:hypothetical protein
MQRTRLRNSKLRLQDDKFEEPASCSYWTELHFVHTCKLLDCISHHLYISHCTSPHFLLAPTPAHRSLPLTPTPSSPPAPFIPPKILSPQPSPTSPTTRPGLPATTTPELHTLFAGNTVPSNTRTFSLMMTMFPTLQCEPMCTPERISAARTTVLLPMKTVSEMRIG